MLRQHDQPIQNLMLPMYLYSAVPSEDTHLYLVMGEIQAIRQYKDVGYSQVVILMDPWSLALIIVFFNGLLLTARYLIPLIPRNKMNSCVTLFIEQLYQHAYALLVFREFQA